MLTVRFVLVSEFHTLALLPVNVQVPVPMVRVRALLLLEENVPTVTFLPLASKVPLVRVNVLLLVIVPISKLSASW